MKYTKLFGWMTLAAGLALTGAPSLSAQDWDRHEFREYQERRDLHNDYRDLRNDHRDLRNDYAAVYQLREAVERDRYRLNEDFRCGRRWAVARDQQQLEYDEYALRAYAHDIQHDRVDMYRDHRDINHDWRDR